MRESSARASRSICSSSLTLSSSASVSTGSIGRYRPRPPVACQACTLPARAGARDGARGVRGLEQRRQHDLVGIGEAGLLAGERAHADALLDAVGAVLDDAVLERPGLLARELEIEVGVIDGVTHHVAEHARDAVLVEFGRARAARRARRRADRARRCRP